MDSELNGNGAYNGEKASADQDIDVKLLSNVIIELNISRKNVTLYPLEHPIIEKAVNKAYTLLNEIFVMRDEISLGIAKKTLIVGQNYLDRNNPVFMDFAGAMNEKMIASISFIKGLSVDELNVFLTLVSQGSDDISEGCGISKCLREKGVEHIVVTGIDYDAFHLTSENEISAKTKGADDTSEKLWDSFVYNLVRGTLDRGGREDSGAGTKTEMMKIDSKVLAEMLNESRRKKKIDEKKYDKIIAEYLNEVNRKENLNESDRKKLIKNIANFTNDLSPEIRKQLLSSTFTSAEVNAQNIGEFVHDLSNEAILETMQEVNEQKLEVPQTILNLLEKFSSVSGKKKDDDGDISTEDLKKGIGKLLFEDHQREFTPDLYQSSIDAFVKKKNVQKARSESKKEYDDFVGSFSEEFIDVKYANALMEMYKREEDPKESKMISDKLFDNSVLFIETGQYENASKIWSFFASVAETDEFPRANKEYAVSKIICIRELRVIDELIIGIKLWGRDKIDQIKEILLMFQEMSLKPLLKNLSKEENAYYRKIYIKIISEMDKKAASELIKHINDDRWFFVRNIILLLRNLKAIEYLDDIKKLFTHENKAVKLEAIKTILEFNDTEGIAMLKDAINSEDNDFSSHCTLLAGAYQVTPLTPILVSKLNKSKSAFFDTDIKDKKILIRALGEIADKRAVPCFKDILVSKSLFQKKRIDELKLEIFKNIHRFDRAEIQDIIEIGQKSGNEEIQKICRQLQQKGN